MKSKTSIIFQDPRSAQVLGHRIAARRQTQPSAPLGRRIEAFILRHLVSLGLSLYAIVTVLGAVASYMLNK